MSGLFQPQGGFYFFHLNTCEFLRPSSTALLSREGDAAQKLEGAAKHPSPAGDPALSHARVQTKAQQQTDKKQHS